MNGIDYNVHTMNTREREESLTLEILETIDQKNDMTQRHLAERLGVALGLANSYLKRCVRKGLVKIHQAPANRYLYYLTPKGFSEKSRLTAEYLRLSFDFYRQAGKSVTALFHECRSKGIERILFCGVSELAEIASLRAQEHRIVIVGTYDPGSELTKFLNLPVWRSLANADQHDACLLTALNNTGDFYRLLINEAGRDRLYVPSILGIPSER